MKSHRGVLLLSGCIVLFGILAGRFFYLQVHKHEYFSKLAARNHQVKIKQSARRGSIVDREGRVMAKSIDVPSAYVIPQRIEDKAIFAKAVAPILDLDAKVLEKRLNTTRRFVYLKRHISLAQQGQLEALALKGLDFLREPKRFYPNHYLGSHVIGLSGIDNQGLEGIELKYDSTLRGTPGYRLIEKDAIARHITFDDSPKVDPQDGRTISLTIDLAVQDMARDALLEGVEKHKPKSAVAVVMDVDTGHVLAMVNWPEFDPNRVNASPIKARRNRTITDTFEPGSTFKAFVAGYALDRGLVKPSDKIFCENGAWRIKSRTLHDHKGYGHLSVEDVIVKSSNIGAAKLGFMLGKKDLYQMTMELGFGRRTGIQLPGESGGLVHPYKRWSHYSMSSVPMGHEISLTPLQLTAAFCSMVNGGIQVKPKIIEAIRDNQGRVLKAYSDEKGQRLISDRSSQELRKILQAVVERGTAKKARIKDYTIGGKTGTSQKLVNGKYSHSLYYSSFIGFAPVENPRLCILMGMDEPTKGRYGGTVAAPYVGKMMQSALHYLRVPTDVRNVADAR